jgi:hypothetical protein
MKKRFVIGFLVLLLFQWGGVYEAQQGLPKAPLMVIDAPPTALPGQEIKITVTVKNTIGTRMYDGKVYIDELIIPDDVRDYFDIIVGEQNLPHLMEVNDEETVSLKIRTSESIPGMTLEIPIVLDVLEGRCEEGCVPFVSDPPKYAYINIFRTTPSILLTLDIKSFLIQAEDCGIITTVLDVPFTLKNVGDSSVYNLSFAIFSDDLFFDYESETPETINELVAGQEITGKYKIYLDEIGVGVYTIAIQALYHDRYNKEFFIEEKVTIEVRNEAYSYYSKAIEYYDSCEYSKAKEFYMSAKNKYEEAGNTNMALKIERKIFEIQGNENFEQAQHSFFLGSVTEAKEYYLQAKEYYDKANHCLMADICEEALNSIQEGQTLPPASPGKTDGPGGPSGGGGTGGVFSPTNIIFYVIIILLVLVIFYQRR